MSNQLTTNDLVAKNINTLIKLKGLTQKKLSDEVGCSAVTIGKYAKGTSSPSADFFVKIKDLYDISIDDFLTRDIDEINTVSVTKENPITSDNSSDLNRYCGSYYTYYFDTSNYKGRDFNIPPEALVYGSLHIYEGSSSIEEHPYLCFAILGIASRERIKEVKKELDRFDNYKDALSYSQKNLEKFLYVGEINFEKDHFFINLHLEHDDYVSLIFHRPPFKKPNYIGGLATANSVSKGRQHMPTIQFMGVSRYELNLSADEIHHSLLLGYPNYAFSKETDELIKAFKNFYIEDKASLSEAQKYICIKGEVEKVVRNSLESNVFRYGKVSEVDDNNWYHLIKHFRKN